MNRRGFLAGLLATVCAPVVNPAELIIPIEPSEPWLTLAEWDSRLNPDLINESAEILLTQWNEIDVPYMEDDGREFTFRTELPQATWRMFNNRERAG